MKRPTSSFQYNLTDNSNYVQKTNSLNNNPSIKPT